MAVAQKFIGSPPEPASLLPPSLPEAPRGGQPPFFPVIGPIRRGDRVVLKTKAGEVMLRELKRRTAKSLELQSLNASAPDRTVAAAEVQWIARIVWVSQ